ncbi:MAG: hypothetical protein JO026_00660, partial [Patescibacteria group bacterium]|nr:hypothetical protein [Patescibacteria group bacterium]
MEYIQPRKGTAIVCAGGGMRSAHGAGFLYGVTAKLGIRNPEIVLGSSGNAANVLYVATEIPEQYEAMRRIWTERLSTPRFISYKRLRRIIDIDYLIDAVFKEQEPLDIQALGASPIRYFIPVTNARSGETKYIGREDKIDPFEMLRASKALPFFYGKKVPLPWGMFIDGELGPTLEDHLRFTIEKGAKKILVVDSGSEGTKAGALRKFLYELFAWTKPTGLRHAILRDTRTESVCLTSEHATLLCVQPRHLSAGMLTRDNKKIRDTFDAGVHDALSMKAD